MGFNVVITKKAKLEIEDGMFFYNNVSKKTSQLFYKDFIEHVEYIKKNPLLFQIKFDTFREVPLKTFPYLIVYEVIDKTIIINAVFHFSRNPLKK